MPPKSAVQSSYPAERTIEQLCREACSPLQFNVLNPILRLGEYVEANQPEPVDLELISDEDLDRLQFEQLKRLIEAEPELLVNAAHQLEYTVRPHDPEADIQRVLGNVP